ncbi:MAG: aminotransferase class III-fold pyridoxal phosphate-dependent enzyme, partial [Chloroflexota bacterium]
VPRVLPSLDGELIALATGEDGDYMMRLFSYLAGTPLAEAAPYSRELLTEIGRFMGQIDLALRRFSHPAARRPLRWSLLQAEEVVGSNLAWLADEEQQGMVARRLEAFRKQTAPGLSRLRHGVIHNDANEHNMLVYNSVGGGQCVAGLLDFGDMVWSPIAYEAAVAAAYAMQGASDPLAAAAQLIAGYHQRFPLTVSEVDALHDLITIRLCTTVVLAAKQTAQDPGRPYLSVSEAGAWRVLRTLDRLDRWQVINRYRKACGFAPGPGDAAARREALLARRKRVIGPSLSLSYEEPLHIVRGYGQYLYSETGRAYIDCVNNVAHVGHCHPAVVAAGQRQMAILNTNTRYLHENLLRYAERLSGLLPEPLRVCYFVCSGSEANELALRMARTVTGRQKMIVLDGAYHGNTATLIDHSPYKHDGPGGAGRPAHVLKAPMPDPYRGLHTGDDAGRQYAAEVQSIVEQLVLEGGGPAGIICEPLMGCGGQIVPPAGFLAQAFAHVRQAGGVCIADEVQVGFGRVGSHFWAFESQGAVPDIVTLGKPIGNGHPLGAVVTTKSIAEAFANGMEYFNTFGGNPVSCAIGLAVLDVIEEEGLQARAQYVGQAFQGGLRRLMERQPLVGDVRGLGLFIGLELVKDRQTKEPAPKEAARVIELMQQRGILLSTDGPDHNVIKIKPPLVISEADAEFVVHQLGDVLSRL